MTYSIAPADPAACRGQLLELWGRNLPTATAARFDWLYGRGGSSATLLHTADGELIGAAGLMPRQMIAGGERFLAGQAVDLNVDQQHRTIGPALMLERALIGSVSSGRYQLIYGNPSPNAEVILRRLGYRLLGPMERWTRPIRSEYKLRERIRPQQLARAVAPLVDLGLRLKTPGPRRLPLHLECGIVRTFDHRFDDLWDRAAAQLSVAGVRDAAYLNWRFVETPDAAFQTFALCERATSRLNGYVTFEIFDGFVEIGDLLAADDAAADLLLSAFLRHIRRNGGMAITFALFGNPRYTDRLKRFGFVRRQFHRKLFVHAGKDAGSPITDPAAWYLTRADSDVDQ